MIKNYRNSLF